MLQQVPGVREKIGEGILRAKEKVKHMTGVFTSVFAHAGHILSAAKDLEIFRRVPLHRMTYTETFSGAC